MGSVNSLIKTVPKPLQRIFYKIIPFKYRYGQIYSLTLKSLLSHEALSLSKLRDLQFEQLKDILIHCFQNVPYYKNLFREYGFDPFKLRAPEDVSQLPILTKQLIFDNKELLIADNYRSTKLYKTRTSGSSGNRLEFLIDDGVYKKEAAFVMRSLLAHGADLYDRPSIWLRRYVPSASNGEHSLWWYDHELKRLYMSPYHLDKKTLKAYIDEIKKYNSTTLIGYPSSVYAFACLIQECNIQVPNFKSIHVMSEKVLDQWAEKVEEVFGIKMFAHYGQMEKVSFMYQSDDLLYREALDYGYNEFTKSTFDDRHNLVATGFLNYAMPFVRYKVEDTFELNENVTEVTGMPKTVKKIDGRSDDLLISKTGARLPGVNFYTMMYKINGVKMFQIRQNDQGSIHINLVVGNDFIATEADRLKESMRERVGDWEIKISFVEMIDRNESTGKIRCIINDYK